jgi:hypothetical protein
MNDQSAHNPVTNQGIEPPSPARPNVESRNERIPSEPCTTESAQKQDENIELTRELIRIERGQLRTNALLAIITLVAVLVAIFSAVKSINLTRETSHLDQRAWVAPDVISGKPEEGKPYEITVLVKNTGKTFAREFYMQAGFKRQGVADTPPDFDAMLAKMREEFAGQLTGATSLIAPDGTSTSTIKVSDGNNLTKENMLELTAPTTMMFVFGKITYKDIFNCEHWTRFSVRCFADGRVINYGQYTKDDANEGAGAAKRFEALVKRVAKTPNPAAKVSEEKPTEA